MLLSWLTRCQSTSSKLMMRGNLAIACEKSPIS
ncbi:Uncharacterised protein [Vibrio cholerae]|nr:Uncharacterised protein [Vibrio cholerae]